MPNPRRFPHVRPPSGSDEEPGDATSSGRRDGAALGRLLMESGAVNREQLAAALAAQRKTFLPLGRILRDEHDLKEEALAEALRKQPHAPRIYLRFFPVSSDTQSLLDLSFCRQNEVISFEQLGRLLCVAFSKSATKEQVREIHEVTGLEVKAFQAPWEDIRKKLKLKS